MILLLSPALPSLSPQEVDAAERACLFLVLCPISNSVLGTTRKAKGHMSGMIANLSTRMQVALITGMLPDCGRNCNREAEQLRDGLPEQLQDKITVATVDSYQASTDSLRC